MSVQHYDFDTIIDRSGTDCFKWGMVDEGVLPLWVAEMDFRAPPAVMDALQQRVEHGVFGYTGAPDELREVVVQRMADRYGWTIEPEHILFNPGMVVMLNMAAKTVGKAGDGILMQTPVYGPFLKIPENQQRCAQYAPLTYIDKGDGTFGYEIDFEVFEQAITPQTSLFFLCDPHNPAGMTFSRADLERLAEICLRHDITICADAIHADLLMSDAEHIPIASLSPEIAANTITLIAPTKTFNVPGLPCSLAIVPNDDLRERMSMNSRMTGLHVDIMSYQAALAAYRDGGDWLQAALRYMTDNRDYAVKTIQETMPQLKTTVPDGTFLMWLDCSAFDLEQSATEFFAEEARVALSPGDFFGSGGDFARLNFACPRPILEEALGRMAEAVDSL